LEAQAEWQPSAELQAFLAAGSPPVYIGFGSMSNRNPQATTDLVLAALAPTRQRAILMSGWGGMQLTDTPDYIFPIDSIPHRWLFPRTAAVVHHGGVGTTAAGLSAGVPNIVVPFFGDQPFWGRTVQRLGAGPAPIAHKQLSVDNLAAALHSVISDEHMQAQAAHIGQQIQAEDGVRTAVRLIETAVTG
jgi:sterol 3beta-glucosyltransferase